MSQFFAKTICVIFFALLLGCGKPGHIFYEKSPEVVKVNFRTFTYDLMYLLHDPVAGKYAEINFKDSSENIYSDTLVYCMIFTDMPELKTSPQEYSLGDFKIDIDISKFEKTPVKYSIENLKIYLNNDSVGRELFIDHAPEPTNTKLDKKYAASKGVRCEPFKISGGLARMIKLDFDLFMKTHQNGKDSVDSVPIFFFGQLKE